MQPRRSLIRALGPALLLAGSLTLPARGVGAPYPSIAHLDGYLSASGDCVLLRRHDGRSYSLLGSLDGLRTGDHLLLEGRFAPDPGCGAPGFAVMTVQKLWADDNHRTAYFDSRNGEPFARYAERIGRFSDESGGGSPGHDAAAPGNDRGGSGPERHEVEAPGNDRGGPGPERHEVEAPGGDRESAASERHDADPDHDRADPERTDRNGRHVYQGPHRQVTLVGKLHEAAGACPTLQTTRAVFAVDGDLRGYQAGDDVSISGVLYDRDPNAPCGGPTVVIRGIHGHGSH